MICPSYPTEVASTKRLVRSREFIRDGHLCLWLMLLGLLAWPAHASVATNPNQVCIDCHQSAAQQWQQSDHAKAMAIATKTTVLGNFNQQSVSHHNQHAVFSVVDGQYQVVINEGQHKPERFAIKYTFGHYPLQQYLVQTSAGKLQVLPFAWDTRKSQQGGQRWYHIYSEQAITGQDRLHWRQPLQNWNGMCADCHSDGLKRHYNSQDDSFATTFDNINVGCVSCHGGKAQHVKQQQKNKIVKTPTPSGYWQRADGAKTAQWHGAKRDNQFMDSCFACHALRMPLTDGFSVDKSFLEQFSPQLPTSPNYYPDGQIKDEVYVYGSFLQSKMFAAGVNCLDCHNQHSMKVNTQDNGLCLQCHSNDSYNVPAHHRHKQDRQGAKCVNCHMPQQRYMGVDDRRDHSFSIPRPDVSLVNNSPNACVGCHNDKNDQWAVSTLQLWHGQPAKISTAKQHLMQLNSGQSISLSQHLAIIADESLATIRRASALHQLGLTTQVLSVAMLKPYLNHDEPLLRLASANVAVLLPANDRVAALTPLLKDKLLAVSVAAAQSLLDSQLMAHIFSDAKLKPIFAQAFNALMVRNDINSWRGEGRINQGVVAWHSGDVSGVERAFKTAIKIDPYLPEGYLQLSKLYRSMQRPQQVAAVLQQGIKNSPQSPLLSYELGLHFVRQQDLAQALKWIEQAMKLAPNNSQYGYTTVLVLDGLAQTVKALALLDVLIERFVDNEQLRALKAKLQRR